MLSSRIHTRNCFALLFSVFAFCPVPCHCESDEANAISSYEKKISSYEKDQVGRFVDYDNARSELLGLYLRTKNYPAFEGRIIRISPNKTAHPQVIARLVAQYLEASDSPKSPKIIELQNSFQKDSDERQAIEAQRSEQARLAAIANEQMARQKAIEAAQQEEIRRQKEAVLRKQEAARLASDDGSVRDGQVYICDGSMIQDVIIIRSNNQADLIRRMAGPVKEEASSGSYTIEGGNRVRIVWKSASRPWVLRRIPGGLVDSDQTLYRLLPNSRQFLEFNHL